MKVLMISTNRNEHPFPVMPFGACTVADSAEQHGHTVHFADFMFKRNPLEYLRKIMKEFIPDVIGISVRNIDNNDMRNPLLFVKELLPLVQLLRNQTKAPMILGGAAFGVMPEELLRFTGLPFGVIGRGEAVFPAILSAIEEDKDFRKLEGVAWLENNEFHRNPLAKTIPHEPCKIPHFKRWITMADYRSRLATVPVQSKRGCVFECVYCTYTLSEEKEYCLHEPAGVADEIRRQVKEGYPDIEFVDNVFNAPRDHALAVCEELVRAKTGARLQTLELNPAFIDLELITAMEKAGFIGVGITPESAATPVLQAMKKGFTAETVHSAADVLRKSTLPCMWIFMLGGPGETEETVRETFRFARESIRPKDIVFFNSGVRLYPGTPLEEIARRQGILQKPSSELLQPFTYLAPGMDPKWLSNFVKEQVLRHMNFIDMDSLRFPVLPALYRVASFIGMSQPIWKHARLMNRGLRFLGIPV